MSDKSSPLTAQQIAQFQDQGFLRLERFAVVEEINWVRTIYDRLFVERAGWDSGDHFDLAGTDDPQSPLRLPQMMNPAHYAPELAKVPLRTAALSLARQLLGASAEPTDEHAICKPEADGVETPWHQDEAYWEPAYAYDALSVWVPLQEVTVENGCMQFIPGSHRLGMLPHHSIGHDVRVHGLTTDDVDERRAVACPLPVGGCTVHHCRTLHYTGPNRSGQVRRAYIMMFQKPPVPLEVPGEFPWLTARRAARQERSAAHL
jgi:hypothetical protein